MKQKQKEKKNCYYYRCHEKKLVRDGCVCECEHSRIYICNLKLEKNVIVLKALFVVDGQ